jgi:hypothetical protein
MVRGEVSRTAPSGDVRDPVPPGHLAVVTGDVMWMLVRHVCCSTSAEQGTPIDMHLILAPKLTALSRRVSGMAPLIFDSLALMTEPGARLCAPLSSPVAVNVSLHKGK